MKKKKVGIVASSVAAIAVCTSVIAGSTYALFTSESKVNIAVTSGKVNLTATVKELGSSSTLGDGKALGAFSSVNGVVGINNIAPGDAFEFTVNVANTSTVKTQYRTSIALDNELLASALEISVGEKVGEEVTYSATYSGLTKYMTEWAPLEAEENPANDIAVKVAFPNSKEDQNKYQGQEMNISVVVEGVQANAGSLDNSDRELIFSASTGSQLEKSVKSAVLSKVNATVNILDDVQLLQELYINNAKAPLTVNGNGHKITATDKFAAVSGQYNLVKINAAQDNSVTINDVTMEHILLSQNVGSYHTLDVFNSNKVNLNNVTLIRNFGDETVRCGAPLVLNGSIVTASNLTLIVGGNAWYGANVDTTTKSTPVNPVAKLILKEGFNFIDYQNLSDKRAAIYCEGNGEVSDQERVLVGLDNVGDVGRGYAMKNNVVGENGEVVDNLVINSVTDLVNFANAVNGGKTFAGKTVTLGKDIDLKGINWTPIGIYRTSTVDCAPFSGTFDGNGHTISNLTINGGNMLGLFGYVRDDVTLIKNFNLNNVNITGVERLGAVVGNLYLGTVENVHVTNAILNGGHWVGGVVGQTYGTVRNCHVDTLTIKVTPIFVDGQVNGLTDGDKAGGIVGQAFSSIISDCSVKNATIIAWRDLGGIVGSNTQDGKTPEVNNCYAENVNLYYTEMFDEHGQKITEIGKPGDTDVNKNMGEIVGRFTGTQEGNDFENVICHKN